MKHKAVAICGPIRGRDRGRTFLTLGKLLATDEKKLAFAGTHYCDNDDISYDISTAVTTERLGKTFTCLG